MAGQNVQYPSNGRTTRGYLATPAAGRGPGVVVIQEWWGLNDQIRGVTDRFAEEGFAALAPDLWHGKTVPIGEPDEAGKLFMALNADEAAKDVRGAAKFLKSHESNASVKVGVIGFCMGGQIALLAGTVAPDEVGAVVDCYGVHPNVKPDFSKLKAAVLGIFGGKDTMVTEAARDQLAKDVRAAGMTFESHVYPEADHAFMNEQRKDVYRAQDAEDAWQRAVGSLREHLK
ncbi:MAG: dienelactone hydrolase family protein [Candidatus Limnocylindria bacterium]